jgi:hypothetical protein
LILDFAHEGDLFIKSELPSWGPEIHDQKKTDKMRPIRELMNKNCLEE